MVKYVYPKEILNIARDYLYQNIARLFPKAHIDYFV